MVLEVCVGVVATRRACCDRLHPVLVDFYSPGVDLSDLLRLSLSTDCLALRAVATGLFEPLGPAFLGGSLPLPLFLRQTTTRAFSAFRAVLGTRSLHIPVILIGWFF